MVVHYSLTPPQTSIKPINPTMEKVISIFYIPMEWMEFVSISIKKDQYMMSHGDQNQNLGLYMGICLPKQHCTIFVRTPFNQFLRGHEIRLNSLLMQSLIYTTANKSIVKKKSFEKSKSWWLEKLTNLRKNYSFIRRKWKRNEAIYIQFSQARNLYFQEIKQAKQKCWNDFLKNADSEQIIKVYKYCK